MPIVTVSGVRKAYGPRVVLRSVDLTVSTRERVGVVGKNGAGKSTLARILAGLEVPDQGSVSRRRGASTAYLDQVPRFEGDPTATEAVARGLAAWTEAVARYEAINEALARTDGDVTALLREQTASGEEVERLGGFEQGHRVTSILGHLGIERLHARISELSGGEQRRVALAGVLIARPDLAILDEPTNHLDALTIEWLEAHLLEDFQGAVLLITHDRYLLDRVAGRTIEIADGEVHTYDGGYEFYLEQKAERLAHAARTEQNRQNFLRRELEWLRRQPKARTTKQKARIERAEEAQAAAPSKTDRGVTFDVEIARSGKTILEARDLGISCAGRRLVEKLDLFVVRGDRIGIVGPNGCGKTTLIRTLLGEKAPESGSVKVGQNTKLAYFDQLRSVLENDKSVFDNVIGDQTRIELDGIVIEPRSYLERFGLDGAKQRQPVASLSGGERARVALAKMLRQSANLLVMDEPTNDLDVDTLGALEAMLVELDVTALVVTHDRWFLDRIATSILAFEFGGKVVRYPGNYESFRRRRAELKLREPAVARNARDRMDEPRPRAKTKKGLTHAETRKLADIVDAIERSEARVSEINALLASPGIYENGGTEVPRLLRDAEKAKAEIERLTARWEELESRKQGMSSDE